MATAEPSPMAGPATLRQAVRDVSRQFWADTNVGGLSQAHAARLPPLRLLWMSLFAVGLVLTVLDVQRVVADFWTHPHDTLLDVVHEGALSFPAVTVCSQSQLDCLRLAQRELRDPAHRPLLRTVLRESGCLSRRGPRCPYQWDALAGLATEQWIGDLRPHCLLCGRCAGVRKYGLDRSDKDRFEDLYEQMGCNSRCLQNNTVLGSAAGRSFPPSDGAGSVTEHGDQLMDSDGLSSPRMNAETEPTLRETKTTSITSEADEVTVTTGEEQPTEEQENVAEEDGTTMQSRVPRRLANHIPHGENTQAPRGRRNAGPSGPDILKRPDRPPLPDPQTPSETHDKSMRFLAHYMALPGSVREEIGLSLEDFIIECSYMGSDCADQRLFRTVTSPQYGNCYTFNSNVTESEDLYAGTRETSLTGDMFSFSLILNMKEYVYPPSRTASLGARIVVHNPDQVPAVEQSGLNLYPQTTTSVAIDQWSVQRLPLPFEAGCAFGWKEVDYEPYSRINDSSVHEMYSVTRCKSMCLQDALIKTCGCFHPLQAAPEGFRRRGDAAPPVSPPCLLTTESDDLLCVRELFERQNTTCHCPSPCYETGYNAQQSMTMWPRQSYLSTLIGRLKLNFSSLLMEDAERLPQNILELKVFYKTLDVQRILQTPKYSYISLVSSVGGAMSLYLGISLVMVAELFEYLVLLAWAVANFYTKSRQGTARKVQPGAELADNMPDDFGKVPPSYTAETTLYPVPSKALYLPPKSSRALKW